ncbi:MULTISPECIES: hypothetical protein [unclassified Novosphingobium]|nr:MULTISPECIES: hypothetical protein [unclassified Novosphingobium]MBB3358312.1 hypothetical protein [Novosphingobium sp. BK256]MBB3477504.1 hypothetical protein [Novosphingobium sp. BK369]MBB3537045.1 hypothetical protein [Novosphingobium sp. BK486]MBB3374673.1 hypothetical protein [Novosphingobium sp. BK280]MBB3379085.1 hypothetical protein [Novosphingobium sp. BK258]
MMQKYSTGIAAICAVLSMAAAPPQPDLARVDARAPAGSGRFPAVMEQAASFPGYTVFAPAHLATQSKLPVVLWANGGCMAYGNRYRTFLTEIASHGYLVISIGGIGPATIEGGSEEGMPPPPVSMTAPALSNYTQLTDALDWATAQNRDRKSALFAKVNTAAVAVMGHSCGGLQAIAAAADPRIKTTLVMNSGVWNKGTGGLPGAPVTKASLAKLHGSVLYIGGDASDGAHENSRDDFERITSIPAVWAYPDGVGHGGTYFEPGGGTFGSVVVNWLQWRLRGDRAAASLFSGPDCGLCRDTRWHIARKNLK